MSDAILSLKLLPAPLDIVDSPRYSGITLSLYRWGTERLIIFSRSQGKRQKSNPGNVLQSSHLITMNWLEKNVNMDIKLTVVSPRQEIVLFTFYTKLCIVESYFPMHKLLWLLFNSIIL